MKLMTIARRSEDYGFIINLINVSVAIVFLLIIILILIIIMP